MKPRTAGDFYFNIDYQLYKRPLRGMLADMYFYPFYAATVVGAERAGHAWSVYRFPLDSPIPLTKSIKAAIEHRHANHRSDNFLRRVLVSDRTHAPCPPLTAPEDRLPKLYLVGGVC